jgi:hypothetical protein
VPTRDLAVLLLTLVKSGWAMVSAAAQHRSNGQSAKRYGAPMPQGKSEPIRLKFVRSTINPRSILVDEALNPHGFDEVDKWAKRKIEFVVIDADTGEDITRILLAQN